MSQVDIAQIDKYRRMLGLTNFDNSNTQINMILSTTIMKKTYISDSTIINNNISGLSDLYVLKDTEVNSINVTNNLYTTSLSCNNLNSMSNINGNNIKCRGLILQNDSICNNFIGNFLSISSKSTINNNIIANNIIANNLTITSNNIIIGKINSDIKINGNVNYANFKNIIIKDKYIVINNNLADHGYYSGFIINSTGTTGFIRTNLTADRYEIKLPNKTDIRYIATTDSNDNLSISGNTEISNDISVLSNLYINGNMIANGNSIFNDNLILSGNSIFNNNVTFLSKTIINNNIAINGKLDLTSDLAVVGSTVFRKCTLTSDLHILGTNTIPTMDIGSNCFVSSNSTVNNNFIASSNLNLTNNLTTNNGLFSSNVFVGTDAFINTNLILGSDLNVSNNAIFNNKVTLNSNITIGGNAYINGDITIGTMLYSKFGEFLNNPNNMNTITIMSQIIQQLPHYDNNADAIRNNIPLWGFYRTGGIMKIRLDDTPPILSLSGNSTITINFQDDFYEPGAFGVDNVDQYLDVYIKSISNTFTSNIISPYLITNNTIITNTSLLPIGDYIIEYSSTDTCGNIGTITRNLKIDTILISNSFTSSNIHQSFSNGGNNYTITNNNLINGNNVVWTFNNIKSLDFNNDWSVILKCRAISWLGEFRINFDPLISYWSSSFDSISNSSFSVSFQDSGIYFGGESAYWDSSIPPIDLYSKFNSLNGIYIKIYKSSTTNLLYIDFYDHNGILIDSKSSKYPFTYTNNNALFSISCIGNIMWYGGYAIYEKNTNITVNEFKSIFEV